MLTVRDLMASNVLTLYPDETLRSAALRLEEEGVSAAPVVHGDQVVGLVSRADILAFVAGRRLDEIDDPDLDEHTIGWIFGGAEGDAPHRAGELVEHAPVPPDVLDAHTVAEVMATDVPTVPPGLPLRDAAVTMARKGVHRVVVLEHGAPVGILTSWDVVCAVARGGLVPREGGLVAGID